MRRLIGPSGARIALFLQGCFWHGCPWHCNAGKLPPFWRAKVEMNRACDELVSETWESAGYRVLQVWEHEWRRDQEAIVKLITQLLRALV